MKAAYGRFCSLKEKSVQLYKDYLKNDRKFQNFIKVSVKFFPAVCLLFTF